MGGVVRRAVLAKAVLAIAVLAKMVLPALVPVALVAAALLLPLLAGVQALRAADLLPSGPTHRGVVTSGTYQLFPENRPGNAVYEDGQLVFTLPDDIIVSVAALAPRGRFLYTSRNALQQRAVAVRVAQGDPLPRMTEVAKGYFYVVGFLDGVGYKKFYRVQDRGITDLLTASHTADGLAVGRQGIAFYHVNRAAPAPDGSGQLYGMRLHLALFGQERTRHLGQDILTPIPALKLSWLEDTQLQVALADGTTRTIDIEQFK